MAKTRAPKPKRARIGAFTVDIEFNSKVLQEIPASGLASRSQMWMLVDDAAHPLYVKDTVLHESLHHMWKQTSLLVRYPDEAEDSPGELIIQDLTPLLLSFIRENPRLVAWLQD